MPSRGPNTVPCVRGPSVGSSEVDEQFRVAMRSAAGDWLPVGPGVDPNTVDLWWLARRIEQRASVQMPQDLPDVIVGISLVDCVETNLRWTHS